MTAETAADPRAPTAGTRRRRGDRGWGSALIAIAVVFAATVWVVSPRFSITFPSLIDDWFAIDSSPNALRHLLRLDYVPEEVGDARRFRPAYTAVWNWLQWHTFDAPQGLVGPNAWNLLRLGALGAAPVLIIAGAVSAERRRALWTAVLACAAGLVLMTTPALSISFARMAPVEPLLVAWTVLGGLLLIVGTQRWLRGRRRPGVAALLVPGYLLWVLGVYEKEASVCALVLAPFLFVHLARRWRESAPGEPALWRRRPALTVAALALLPVLHMLWELKRIASGGQLIYGASAPGTTTGLVTRAKDAFVGQWRLMDTVLGTRFLTALCIATVAAVLACGFHRRRIPWIEIGLMLTGWAALVFHGLGGELAPRYYIPTIALFLAACGLALVDAPVLLRAAAVAAAAIYVGSYIDVSRSIVDAVAISENQTRRSMYAVGDLHPARCPVYMGSMETEIAESVPELLAFVPGSTGRGCRPRWQAVLVRGLSANTAIVTNEAIHQACEKPGWVRTRKLPSFWIFGCRRLKRGAVAGQPVQRILAQNRLLPGVGFTEQQQRLRRAGG